MDKPKRNKHKKYSQIDLNVNPIRKAEKIFKYSSIRQADWSLLFDTQKQDINQCVIQGKKVIKFDFPAGAYIVKNFLSADEVLNVSQQSLNQFVQKPYRNNLSGDKGLYKDQSHSERQNSEQQDNTQDKQGQENVEKQIKEQKNQTTQNYNFNQKIRWSNLGYNYDWTNRAYPKTKTQMPLIIQNIAQKANSLFNQLTKQQRSYTAEAVIVNYYKQKDAMTAHLDDAQQDQQSPIYSFAFGLSCVFIIGDTHKNAEPLCVRINSGDLFIMSGYSRRCYHGVPRVISGSYTNEQVINENPSSVPNTKQQTLSYLKTHRININIRQVYNKSDSI